MPSGFSARFAGQNENWPPSNSRPGGLPPFRILPDAEAESRQEVYSCIIHGIEVEQPPCKTRAIRPHFFPIS